MESGEKETVVQTAMSSFIITKCQETVPKNDKLRNNSDYLEDK